MCAYIYDCMLLFHACMNEQAIPSYRNSCILFGPGSHEAPGRGRGGAQGQVCWNQRRLRDLQGTRGSLVRWQQVTAEHHSTAQGLAAWVDKLMHIFTPLPSPCCDTLHISLFCDFACGGGREKESFELGAEGSGTIVAVGTGCSLEVGDSVAFISGGGGFAEYLTIKEAMLVKVQEASAEAAALRYACFRLSVMWVEGQPTRGSSELRVEG